MAGNAIRALPEQEPVPLVAGVPCCDLTRRNLVPGVAVPDMAMLMPELPRGLGENGHYEAADVRVLDLRHIRLHAEWLCTQVGLHRMFLVFDEELDIMFTYRARRSLALLETAAYRLLTIMRNVQVAQGVDEEEEPEDDQPVNIVHEPVVVRGEEGEPAEVIQPEVELPGQPAEVDPVIEQPAVEAVVAEAPQEVQAPDGDVVIREAVRVAELKRQLTNRQYTPNRFGYRGLKRNADHLSADPANPPYVREPNEERQKMNFLCFFNRRRRPRVSEFSDADLVNYLRMQSFCVPRTPNLIQSLKLKAIRYMSDFDMSDYSSTEIYRIMASSIAAALVVTNEEEMVRETIRDHSNMIEKYQPFFSQGQYRSGFLGFGVRSLS